MVLFQFPLPFSFSTILAPLYKRTKDFSFMHCGFPQLLSSLVWKQHYLVDFTEAASAQQVQQQVPLIQRRMIFEPGGKNTQRWKAYSLNLYERCEMMFNANVFLLSCHIKAEAKEMYGNGGGGRISIPIRNVFLSNMSKRRLILRNMEAVGLIRA